jgi:hypothetical protein
MRKTNPTSGGPRYPAFQPDANRAKQSQFLPEQQEGQVFCGKGVMVNCTSDRPRQNKANLQTWKQRMARITRMNEEGETGQIRVMSVIRGSRTFSWRPQATLAKQSQFAAGAGWDEGREANVQNKPNSRRRRAGRGRRGVGRGANCAKRSQFGPWKMSGEDAHPTRSRRGAKCAKETRFREVRPAGGIPSIPLFYHSTIPVRCLLCETKPIGKVSSFKCQVSSLRSGSLSCETKPICPGIGFQGSGVSELTPDPRPLTPGAPGGQLYKQTQFAGSGSKVGCLREQTKPICALQADRMEPRTRHGGPATAAAGIAEKPDAAWGRLG